VSWAPLRAAGRVAWRNARRNVGRSALVLSMVALPVMLVTAVAGMARTSISTPGEAAAWDAVAFVAGALGLFGTGLIAAAAFVVGARRQLRDLGLVGAVGGERRHVLAVVVLGGTLLGLVGSVAGALLGIVAVYLSHPWLDDLVGHAVGAVKINLLVIAGAVAMGTAAATLAALAPARAAARLSTVEALAGRSGLPRPPGRVAGAGVAVIVAGGVVTIWGTQTDHDLLQVGGLILTTCGFLFSIPLLVGLLGRLASRLPMTGRLAARDAARHGRRTGAAVAAAVIALSLPVAVSTYSSSVEKFKRDALSLDERQLMVAQQGEIDVAVSTNDDLAQDLEQAIAGARVVVLDRAVERDLGIDEQFNSVYLVTAHRPLSSRDMERADDVAGSHPGVYVFSADDYLPDYSLARVTATFLSLSAALAIVAVAVALVASESRRSRQILVAVGAGPMTHRKLLAATSSLLALISGVLAIPAGLVPLLVLWATASRSDLPLVLPWATIVLVLFAVPLVAGLLGGAVARPPKMGSLLDPAT
jgi:ABC-type antimicrobial peptide transport system permease subunit